MLHFIDEVVAFDSLSCYNLYLKLLQFIVERHGGERTQEGEGQMSMARDHHQMRVGAVAGDV